jgi:hypothetical protein
MNALPEKKFISTAEASELSGYNPDHLARLAREGAVEAIRVGRTWHVERESLESFLKKQGRSMNGFPGLISTKDASKKYGYSPDYLARLARNGEIVGSQVGRTWLVDRESIAAFFRVQEERKEARARALARAREEEYRVHQTVASVAEIAPVAPQAVAPAVVVEQDPVALQSAIREPAVPVQPVQTAPVIAPKKSIAPVPSPYGGDFQSRRFGRLPDHLVRRGFKKLPSRARAFAIALLVIAAGSAVAQSGSVSKLAVGTASLARDVASGFSGIPGNVTYESGRIFNDQFSISDIAYATRDAYFAALGRSAATLDALARSPQVAAVIAAAEPALGAGEQVALATYETLHGFFASTSRALAALFTPPPTIIVVNNGARTVATATTTTSSPKVATSSPKISAPPARPIAAPPAPTYPTYVTTINGVSQEYVDRSLASLRVSVLGTVAGMIQPVAQQSVTNVQTTQYVNMIQRLDSLTVTNGNYQKGTFDGGSLTNGIYVGAREGVFDSLTVGSATTLATTTITGDLAVSGTITPTVVIAGHHINSPYFVATDATATSTFAGSLAVGGNATTSPNGNIATNGTLTVAGPTGLAALTASGLATFESGFIANASSTITSGLFTASGGASTTNLTASGTGYFGSSVAIGTSTPDALLALQQTVNGLPIISAYRATDVAPSGDFINFRTAAGTTLFRVDNSGNLLAGGIVNSGSQTITSTSQPQLRVQYDGSNEITTSVSSTGATTFGINGSAPSLTFAPQTNSVNTFNFTDALAANSVLSIDTLNRRVGVGSTSPSSIFAISNSATTAANIPLFIIASTTGGTSTSTLMTVLANGNVGIGTASPSGLLTLPFSTTENRITFQDPSGFNPYIGGATGSGVGQGLQVYSPGGIAFSAFAGNSAPLSNFNHPLLLQPNGVFSSYPYGLRIYLDGSYGGAAKTGLLIDSFASNTSPLIDVNSGTTNVFRIQPNGNVGIGTTSPYAKLSVQGSGVFTGGNVLASTFTATSSLIAPALDTGSNQGLSLSGGTSALVTVYPVNGDPNNRAQFQRINLFGTNDIVLDLVSQNTSGYGVLDSYGGGGLMLGTGGNSSPIIFYTNRVEKARFDGSGNLGIGTTSPYAQLSIATPNGATGSLSTLFAISSSTQAGATTTLMTVLANGNVGIGTSSPMSKLTTVQTAYTEYALAIQNEAGIYTFGSTHNANNLRLTKTSGAMDLNISGTGNALTSISFSGADGRGTFVADGNYDWYLNTNDGYSTGTMYLNNTSTGNIVMASGGGKVGIGSTTPWGQLSVNPNGITGPAFVVGSSTATNFIVTNGGNVGIGTTNPSSKLHIAGNGAANGLQIAGNQLYEEAGNDLVINTVGGGIRLFDTVYLGTTYNGGTPTIRTVNNTDISLGANGSQLFVVRTDTGNVGIGTTSPFAKLSVAGDAYIGGNLTATGTLAVSGLATLASASTTNLSVSNNLWVGGNATTTSSGNFLTNGSIGIGQTSTSGPNDKLDIGTAVLDSASANIRFTYTPNYPNYFHTIANKFSSSVASDNMTFNLTQNGTTVTPLTLVATGNVGIGTTTPSAKLDINTGNASVVGLNITDVGGQAAALTTWTRVDNIPLGAFGRGADTYGQLTIYGVPSTYVKLKGDNALSIDTGQVATFRLAPSGNDLYYQNTNSSGDVYFTGVGGANSTGQFLFRNTGNVKFGSSGAERMVILTNGNVGIGTTSPYAQLSIATPNGATGSLSTLFAIASSTQAGATSTLMTVLANGNVGIGTTIPQATLQIGAVISAGTSNSVPLTGYALGVAHGTMAISSPETASGNVTNTLINLIGSEPGAYGGIKSSIDFSAFDRGNAVNDGVMARITGGLTDSVEHPGQSGILLFGTAATGATTPTTRMVINNTGNVGIGTTTPGQKLSVAGDILGNNFIGSYFTATSTIATSTFAGGVTGPNNFTVQQTSGNVGIGTTSPGAQLHIADSTNGDPLLLLDRTATSDYGQIGFATADVSKWTIGLRGGEAANGLSFFDVTNNIHRMVVSTAGNVGIGTTSPGAALQIGTSGGASWFSSIYNNSDKIATFGYSNEERIRFSVNANSIFGSGYGPSGNAGIALGSAYLTNNGTNLLLNAVSGNVGIGTTSPYSKLSIWGANTTSGVRAFEVTNSASTTAFAVDNAGNATIGNNLTISGTGTTTLAGFIDVNGTGANATSTFASNLWVKGTLRTGTGSMYLTDDGLTSSDGDITLSRSGTSWLNAGAFGIGTSTPSVKFSVGAAAGDTNGHAYFTGGLGVGKVNTTPGSIIASGNVTVGLDSGSSATLLISKLPSCNTGSQVLQTDGSGGIICGNVTAIGGTSAGGWTWVTPNKLQLATSTDLVGVGTVPATNVKLTVDSGSTATTTMALWATAGQTVNILDIYDNTRALTTVIDENGSLGLGMTSPASRLQVGDSTVNTLNQILIGKYETATESGYPLIQQKSILNTGAGNDLALGAQSTTGGILFYTGAASPANQLGTSANTIKMAITASGNVGIGTTSPWGLLSVNANALAAGTPQFVVGSSTATNFIVANSGNVGIGTTTPYTKFVVADNGGTLAFQNVNQNNLRVSGVNATLVLDSIGTAYPGIFLMRDGVAKTQLYSDSTDTYLHSSGTLSFSTNGVGGATEVTINTAGNVGIGTTTPSAKLHINQAPAIGGQLALGFGSDGNTGFSERVGDNLTLTSNGTEVWANDANEMISLRGTGTQSAPRIRFASGAVNIPTYAFQFDQDSGMWNPGTDLLEFTTGGVSRLRIDTTGNVGIGTTTPASLLSVHGTSYVSGTSFFGGAITATSTLTLSALGTPAGSLLAVNASGQLIATSTISVANLALAKGNFLVGNDVGVAQATSTIFISSTGSVGIGTVAPVDKLHIHQSAVSTNYAIFSNSSTGQTSGDGSQFGIDSTGNAYVWNRENLGLYLGTNNTTRLSFTGSGDANFNSGQMFIQQSTGNVGIGTTTPGQKLSVAGDILGNNFIGSYFTATSTIATSTFAGGVTGPNSFTIQQGSGNVGIGTANPTQKLEVDGNIYLNSSSAQNPISSVLTTASQIYQESLFTSGVFWAWDGADANRPYYYLDRNTANVALVPGSTSGKVGVGTTTPGSKLSVAAGVSIGANYNIAAPTNGLIVEGNVGIGTTSPGYTLGVNGSLGITGIQYNTRGSSVWSQYGSGTEYYTSAGGSELLRFSNNSGVGGISVGSSYVGTAAPSGGAIIQGSVGIGTTSPIFKLDVTNGGGVATIGNSTANTALAIDTGAGSYLRIRTGGQEAISINGENALSSDQFVGIGTTSPASRLAVSGGASIGANYNIAAPTNGLIVEGNVGIGTASPANRLEVSNSVSGQLRLSRTNSGAFDYNIETSYVSGETTLLATGINSSMGFGFRTNSGSGYVDALFVNKSGNVGVGTTSPVTPLHVYTVNSGDTNGVALFENSNSAGGFRNANIRLRRTNTIYNDSAGGNIVVEEGRTDGTTAATLGKFGVVQDASFAQTPLSSFVVSLNNGSALTEYMRIKGNGNVGIGTTTPRVLLTVGSSTPNAIASGNYYNSAYVSGDLEVDGTIYGTISGSINPNIGNNIVLTTNSSGAIVGSSSPSVASIFATSTTATSTFAGGITGPNSFTIQQASGRLGLGNASPSTLLDVNGTTTLRNQVAVNTSAFSDNTGNIALTVGVTSPMKSGIFVADNFNQDSAGAYVSAYVSNGTNKNAFFGARAADVVNTVSTGRVGWTANFEVNNGSTGNDTGSVRASVNTVGGVIHTGTSVAYNAFNYISSAGTTLNSMIGYQSSGQFATADVSLTNLYDFYAGNYYAPTNGTTTNRYGVYLGFDNTTGAGTTNAYGIYQTSSTVKNYFAGNVGIGTTSPDSIFTIDASAATPQFVGTNDARLDIRGKSDSTAVNLGLFRDTNGLRASGYYMLLGSTGTDLNKLQFVSRSGGDNIRVTFDTSGNVGIGTTTPATKLQISGTAGSAEILLQRTGASTPTGQIYFEAENGSGRVYGSALKGYNGAFEFYTDSTPNDTTNNLSNTMILTSGGSLGIGTTSPYAKLGLVASDASVPGLLIKSAANSGTGNLLEIQRFSDSLVGFKIQNTTGNGTLDMFLNGNAAIGGVGIGSNVLLNVGANLNDPSVASYSVNSSRTIVLSSNNANDVVGVMSNISRNADAFNTTGSLMAGQFKITDSSTGVASNEFGVYANLNKASNGTTTNWYGVASRADVNNVNGYITNLYNFYAYNGSKTGTVTNQYGLYLENITGAANNNYAIYSAGGQSYFAGNVGIGTTNPQTKLDVQGIASSTTFYANAGTLGAPAYAFAGYPNAGLSFDGTTLQFSIGGSNAFTSSIANGVISRNNFSAGGWLTLVGSASGGLGLGSGHVVTWGSASTNNGVAGDIGLSRGAAGKLYVGNGTSGDYTGTLIAGNVGIGTTSPYAMLSVNGSSDMVQFAVKANSSQTANILEIRSGAGALLDRIDSAGSIFLADGSFFSTSPGISLVTAGSDVSISPTGSFIGNTLQNNGTNDISIQTVNTQNINFLTDSANRMKITATGNVGIGTTTPWTLLTVGSSTPNNIASTNYYNSAYVSGDLEVDGTIYGTISGSINPNIGNNVVLTTNSSGAIVGSSSPSVAAIFATSTAATSTFAGGITGPNSFTIQQTSGNVGIGVSNPTSQLSITSSQAIPSLSISHPYSGSAVSISKGGNGDAIYITSTSAQTNGIEYSMTDAGTALFNTHILGYAATVSTAYDSYSVTAGKFSSNQTRSAVGSNPDLSIGVDATALSSIATAGSWGYAGRFTAGTANIVAGLFKGATSQTADIFQVQKSDGTSYLNVSSSGNVGIGTTTPITKTEIVGTRGSNSEGQLLVTGNADHAYIEVRSTTPSTKEVGIQLVGAGTVDSPNWGIKIPANSSDLQFVNVSSVLTAMTIKNSSGNVGIGTTSPASRLAVSGGASIGANYNIAAPTNGLIVEGNVGIGTASPSASYTLDVNGSARLGSSNGTIGSFVFNQNTFTHYYGVPGETTVRMRYGRDINPSGGNGGTLLFGTDGQDISLIGGGLGQPSSGTLAFFTGNGSALVERVRVNNTGNVGIGTTSPFAKLSVAGDAYIGGNLTATGTLAVSGAITAPYFVATNALATSTFAGGITGPNNFTVQQTSGNVGIGVANPTGKLTIGSGQILAPNGTVSAPSYSFTSNINTGIWSPSTDVVGMAVSGSDRVRFTVDSGSGFFAVSQLSGSYATENSDTTGALIGVHSQASTAMALRLLTSTDDTDVAPIGFVKTRGTVASPTVIVTGDTLGEIEFLGQVGPTNKRQRAASIRVDSTGSISDSTTGIAGVIRFLTADTGSEPAERLTILNNGNVGIGTTTPGQKLSVAGDILGNNIIGSYFTATSTTATSTFAGGFAVETSGLVYDYSSNNVGIGTASPGGKLAVSGGQILASDGSSGLPGYGFISNLDSGMFLSGAALQLVSDGTEIIKFYSNQIVVGTLGTASVPAINHTASGNSGIYWPTSNSLGLSANGSEVVRLSSAGNVGIGTTSPYAKLSVAGDILGNNFIGSYFTATSTTATSTFAGFIDVNGTGANATSTFASNLWVKGTLRTGTGSMYLNDVGLTSSDGNINLSRSATSTLGTNGLAIGTSQFVVQQTSGNVGIGTTTPSSKLHLSNSSGSTYLTVNADGNESGIVFRNAETAKWSIYNNGGGVGNELYIYNYAGTAVAATINSSGYLGIGSTSPAQMLSVAGKIYTTTGIQFPDGSLQTAAAAAAAVGTQGQIGFYNANGSTLSGTSTITITQAGLVGIGTTTPADKLSIGGVGELLKVGGPGEGTSVTYSRTMNNGGDLLVGVDSSSGGAFFTGSKAYAGVINTNNNTALQFGTNNTARMTIDTSGDVGIGTTSPTYIFHVASTTGSVDTALQGAGATSYARTWYSLGDTVASIGRSWNVGIRADSSLNYGYSIESNSGSPVAWTSKLFITQTGNVGIGTTTPGAKLTVVDTANVVGSSGAVDPGFSVVNNEGDYFQVAVGGTSAGTAWYMHGPDSVNFNSSSGGYHFNINSAGDLAQITSNGSFIVGAPTGGAMGAGTINATAVYSNGVLLSPGTGSNWSVSGADIYRSAGNVGIGTTSPWGNLSVSGSSVAGNIFTMVDNTDNNIVSAAGYKMKTGVSANVWQWFARNGDMFAGVHSVADFMVIKQTGNVGIGTTTPNMPLTVKAGVNTGINLVSATGLYTLGSIIPRGSSAENAERGAFTLSDTGVNTIVLDSFGGSSYINSGGNVGIGTTSPYSLLSISNSATTAVNTPLFTIASTTAGTATSTIMTVLANGNIGIGTTNPVTTLDIAASTGSLRVLSTNSATYSELSVSNNDQSATSYYRNYGTTAVGTVFSNPVANSAFFFTSNNALFGVGTYSNAPLVFGTNNIERIRVDTSGNVGIGTTTPNYQLQVSSTTNATMSLNSYGNREWWMSAYKLSGADADLRIGTGSAYNTPHFTIQGNSGNVGIGTTSPQQLLDIYSATGHALYAAHENGTTDASGLEAVNDLGHTLGIYNQGSSYAGSLLGVNRADASTIVAWANSLVVGTNGAQNLTLSTNNAARMTIDTSGNVGIGTTGPNTALDVVGLDTAADTSGSATDGIFKVRAAASGLSMDIGAYSGGSTSYGWIQPRNIANYAANYNLVLNPNGGNVGIGTTTPGAKLHVWGNAELSGSAAGNSNISYLTFNDVNGIRKGYVGDDSGSDAAIGLLSDAGDIRIGGTGGSCTLTGAASGGTCFSDQALKSVQGDITGVLNGISSIQLKTFYWNDLAHQTTNASTTILNRGFIAQDVENVFPELVRTDENGYKTLDYGSLGLYAIEGIRELDSRTRFIENATTSTVLSVDVAGRIGIGTSTPNHTLEVAGEIGAIAFINTSTRNLKTDINYATASSTSDMLTQLTNLKVATYRYKIESQQDPLRIGLIAEDTQAIAPEILSIDGKGIDLYKLATFTLAGVQALADKVNAQETRITSLEERLAALESGAISTATSSMLSLSTSSLASAIESIGSVLRIGKLVSDTFYAAQGWFDNLTAGNATVGTPTAPAGVTLYDQVTKQPYCFSIANGAPTTTPGICALVTESVNPFATTTPATATSTISIIDTGPLTITLNGATPTYVAVGAPYAEEGAVVTGGSDGTAPYTVYVNGIEMNSTTPALDTSAPTTYIITYRAVDTAGQSAIAYRSVIVEESVVVTVPADTATSTPVVTDTASTTPITITDVATTTTDTTATSTTASSTTP